MITKQGYKIPITPENEKICRDFLIHAPKQLVDYGPPLKPVVNYIRDSKYFYIPRHFGIEHFGVPNKIDNLFTKLNPNITFEGTLRPYQNEIITQTKDIFIKNEYGGGIWSVMTGMGKTITALKLICVLGYKTIVIVNKEVLLQQWRQEIQKFIPSARIGHIQSTIIKVDNCDIVLAMLQSLSLIEYDLNIFKEFGLMIIDETHNVCSTHFSKVLHKVQAKYRLGLSATPNRKDGLEIVMKQHLGPIIVELSNIIVEPSVRKEFFSDPSCKIKVSIDYKGNICMPKLITSISEYADRNKFLISLIVELLESDRRIILFSDRVNHCKKLIEGVTPLLPKGKTAGLFIGGLKEEQYNSAKICSIIFCTYSIAKEGFNVPELDTLIMATPKTDLVQIIGRILRQKNKNFPLVVDIIDKDTKPCLNMFYRRNKYYTQKGYVSKDIRENVSDASECGVSECGVSECGVSECGALCIIDE